MKKFKNFLRFSFISLLVLVVFIYIGRFIFRLCWNFDILDKNSYMIISDYWNSGGVFDSFRDYSLGFAIFLFPILWLYYSRKLYKYGLGRFLSEPIIKSYRRLTRPESMEIEHVVVKNLGGKDKSLEDIIADKIKEQGQKGASGHTTKDLRQQISAKIGENEKQ